MSTSPVDDPATSSALPGVALATRGLTVRYGQFVALDDVSIQFPTRAMSAVIGPNGSGKSSLLKAILGLVPHDGEVSILGKTGSDARRQLAWVPQRSVVDWDFPISVADVVMQGRSGHLGLFGRPRAADRDATGRAIAHARLESLAERPIGALSGGQQQRAFIARALASEAPVLLLDEPFAGLDAPSEQAIIEVLKEACAAGTTVIVVHHDLGTVEEHFQHAVLLRTRAIASGPVDLVLRSRHVAEVFGARRGPPLPGSP